MIFYFFHLKPKKMLKFKILEQYSQKYRFLHLTPEYSFDSEYNYKKMFTFLISKQNLKFNWKTFYTDNFFREFSINNVAKT